MVHKKRCISKNRTFFKNTCVLLNIFGYFSCRLYVEHIYQVLEVQFSIFGDFIFFTHVKFPVLYLLLCVDKYVLHTNDTKNTRKYLIKRMHFLKKVRFFEMHLFLYAVSRFTKFGGNHVTKGSKKDRNQPIYLYQSI